MLSLVIFFCKQKTAYEMRISDWSSDVCSSDLEAQARRRGFDAAPGAGQQVVAQFGLEQLDLPAERRLRQAQHLGGTGQAAHFADRKSGVQGKSVSVRVDYGGCRHIKK